MWCITCVLVYLLVHIILVNHYFKYNWGGVYPPAHIDMRSPTALKVMDICTSSYIKLETSPELCMWLEKKTLGVLELPKDQSPHTTQIRLHQNTIISGNLFPIKQSRFTQLLCVNKWPIIFSKTLGETQFVHRRNRVCI